MTVTVARALRGATLAFVSVAAASACYAPTQIDVEVSTDLDCDVVRAGGIAIFVADSTAELATGAAAAITNQCTARSGGDAEIGSLFLTPGGARDASVVVEVVAGVTRPPAECAGARGDGCIVSRRRIAYVPHKTLTLKMMLQRSCLGIQCAADQTCWQGRCSSLAVCEGEQCDPTPDGGTDPQPLACPADRGNCDGDDKNGCETELLANGAHCGTCGHDCAGAVCAEGRCAATQLFAADMPSALVVSGADLYVTRELPLPGAAILGCAITGCSSPTVFPSGSPLPNVLAADATTLYWSNPGTSIIESCARPSCTSKQTSNAEGAYGLAPTPSGLLFTSGFNYYVGLRTGAGDKAVLFPSGQPMLVAADETTFFVSAEGYANVSGGLYRCPLPNGCAPVGATPPQLPFSPGPAVVRGMTLDATHVYWTERDTGRVLRATKDLTGGATTLVTGAVNPGAVAVDDTFVYWIDEGAGESDGAVRRARKDGSAPVVLAAKQRSPSGLAIAGARIFWSNRVMGGAVQSVAAR